MIDDGLHTYEAAVCLFQNAIEYLKDGGYYIIEDVLLNDVGKFEIFFKQSGFDAQYRIDYMLMPINGLIQQNNMIIIRQK
jgi:hypothetical protein